MIPIMTRDERKKETKLMSNHKTMFTNHQVTHYKIKVGDDDNLHRDGE